MADRETDRGSAKFYQEQAIRLNAIALDTTDAVRRLTLLEIAASFEKLAEYAAMREAAGEPLSDEKSA
jgi:hypothetical protein